MSYPTDTARVEAAVKNIKAFTKWRRGVGKKYCQQPTPVPEDKLIKSLRLASKILSSYIGKKDFLILVGLAEMGYVARDKFGTKTAEHSEAIKLARKVARKLNRDKEEDV